VLLIAPVFMLAVMSFIMPHGVRLLFTTVPGWALLTIAGLLAGAGVYFAQRITRSEI
jgi:Flp pilus assembly protein TadB